MKKIILVSLFSLFLIMIVNFAQTQESNDASSRQIKFASKERIWILPQTHAELRVPENFLKSWKELKPFSSEPKSINFEYIGKSEKRSILRIHDFKEQDVDQVIYRIKKKYSRSLLKLVNEQTKSFYEKSIKFLFFQDSDQNVAAFNVFKEKESIFALEIETTYNEYSDVSDFFYELINGIKAIVKVDLAYDKIMLNSRTTILVPSSFTYELPFETSYFKANSDDIEFQCFSFETIMSAKEIAYNAEIKFSKELEFKRTSGEFQLRNGIDTVIMIGEVRNGRKVRLFTLEKEEQCFVALFEYNDFEAVKDTIIKIVDSVSFDIQTLIPDKFLPFAILNDKDSDGNPDYFNINIIFFDKNESVIKDNFQKGELLVKIVDDKGKTVFVSDIIEINSPFDTVPNGKCSESLFFDGLWVSKLRNQKYKLSITASFGETKIVYEGKLTDLIVR